MRRPLTEARAIAHLRKSYEGLGLRVEVDSLVAETGLRADLVVRGGPKTLIIEVKNSESLQQEHDSVVALARYAEGRSDTRFDLVLANPKRRRRSDRATAQNEAPVSG